MSDDWRVRADLERPIDTGHVLKALHEHELQDEVARGLPQRLPVTAGDASVFIYCADRDQAEQAAAAMRAVLERHDLRGEIEITCWHAEAEAWEAPDEPLPQTPEEHAAEHARLEAREAQESRERGPQWEVRIDLRSHKEALAVADRLEAEGLRPLRRWTHVFVSAATDDEAHALADRLSGTLPPDAHVTVEGTAADAWRATHPYAVLGGIAN
ncbi:MAG TPA: hypothetical protein VMT10_04370 [Solirubrobacteraceae bacterium]|nr:hypothetical protein [Solirubrobacteraceae bacterium]